MKNILKSVISFFEVLWNFYTFTVYGTKEKNTSINGHII